MLRTRREGGLLRNIDGRGLRLPMSTAVTTSAAEALWHELRDRLRSFIARRVRSPQDA
jgi:hypothetical protein